jgi:flagellar assembly protein FliH
MSDFVPGLAARQGSAGIAEALQRAFAPPVGFAARTVAPRETAPYVEPRHFSPAEPGHKPTEGWDPFDAAQDVAPKPFVDPITAAHDAGYAEGFAAARAEADMANEAQAALLRQVSEALAQGAHFDRERLAGHLRQTVLHLVGKMIGEAGVAPDILAGRIEAAIELLADSAESAILRLNPEDVALVDGKLPKSVFPIADAAVQRGGFVIESASTIVEDGPDLWLEQLAAAIDRVPLPPVV